KAKDLYELKRNLSVPSTWPLARVLGRHRARPSRCVCLSVCRRHFNCVGVTNVREYAWLMYTEVKNKQTKNKFKKKKKKLSGRLPMHLKAFARAMQGYEGYSQLESKPALSSVIKPLRQGRARTQFPTTRNCAVEIPTFEEFAGVSTTGVQWPSLALGKQPS